MATRYTLVCPAFTLILHPSTHNTQLRNDDEMNKKITLLSFVLFQQVLMITSVNERSRYCQIAVFCWENRLGGREVVC